MQIRKATISDIDLLVTLRIDFIYDITAEKDEAQAADLCRRIRDYLNKHLPVGDIIAFIAEENGEAISSAFLTVTEKPPRYPGVSSLSGTVYSVYTYPAHRGRGAATMVMSALIDEAKKLGIGHIDLLATQAGKPMYDKLGFEIITNYTPMRLGL